MANELKLTGRLGALFDEMKAADADDRWMTVPELAARVRMVTGKMASETGISANVRDLRKPANGLHTVDKRRRGGKGNLWEYRLWIKPRSMFD